MIEGCAGGGGRADAAAIARTDVVWPSDNTGPLDRLAIQHGFLHAHAPHVMSSWVTDAAGFFDPRPRSLGFRFVNAMAGVLGIGADLRKWTPEQRGGRRWIALYKRIRDVIHRGTVHLIGTPDAPVCGVQYSTPDGARASSLAWNTGTSRRAAALPGRPDRLRLRGLDPPRATWTRRRRRRTAARICCTRDCRSPGAPECDADLMVLRRRDPVNVRN
jgi:alpha-galactosidase